MYIALISIIVLACVLLILVVMAQNSKGGGLSSQFGGAGASQLVGVKRTGDLLEKLTWSFAIALMALTLSSHMLLDTQPAADVPNSVNVERARGVQQSGPALPDNNLNATQQPAEGSPAEAAQPGNQPDPAATQPSAVPAE